MCMYLNVHVGGTVGGTKICVSSSRIQWSSTGREQNQFF